jgi:hypothetical protein
MTDIDPHIWGPQFWATYHIYASRYPLNPTPIVMDAARAFIKIIPFTLPCSSCTDHAFRYIQNIQRGDPTFDTVVATRATMEKFFFDFHNGVNYRQGKPMLSDDMARNRWTF